MAHAEDATARKLWDEFIQLDLQIAILADAEDGAYGTKRGKRVDGWISKIRFTTESGHVERHRTCLLCANSGHQPTIRSPGSVFARRASHPDCGREVWFLLKSGHAVSADLLVHVMLVPRGRQLAQYGDHTDHDQSQGDLKRNGSAEKPQ
jgi:hypothetical protein